MVETIKMKPHAIMISLTYQGHLNPFASLAINLASKGFTITFVHTKYAHHTILKSRGLESFNEHDLFSEARESGLHIRYTTITDGFPMDFDRLLNFVQFWDYMLKDFIVHVDDLVGGIVGESDSSSFYPFLITDTFQSWPTEIARKYDLVNVSFWTQPALVFALNYHLDLLSENGHYPPKAKEGGGDSITYVPGVESISTKDLMSFLQEQETTMEHKIVFTAFEEVRKADFILLNTIQELESDALLALNQNQPSYAIGPINFSTKNTKVPRSLLVETDCTKWLQSKPPSSVLYISFGSLVQISKLVLEEIAYGILLADIDFIWVVREDIVSYNESDVLPLGFEEEAKERGFNSKMV